MFASYDQRLIPDLNVVLLNLCRRQTPKPAMLTDFCGQTAATLLIG